MENKYDFIVIGGGFCGLSAAYELGLAGKKVLVLEADSELGGLAGSFEILPGVKIEKFYHHWFTSDTGALNLCKELGLEQKLKAKESNTGLYYANSKFRLSSPLDLLKLTAIPFIDRIRTGLMVLYARKIKSWKKLENLSAEEWIRKFGGSKAYEVMWKPLLKGKFGEEAQNISAVWFWNKLKLRGSSRDDKGAEKLYYLEGGFELLLEALRSAIVSQGGEIKTKTAVNKIILDNAKVKGLELASDFIPADKILSTVHLPTLIEICPDLPEDYKKRISQIRYLGNICLVLRLKKSLSGTYWLNVADPSFPFVGIIEHTNFDRPAGFPENESIAFISKYLTREDPLFSLSDQNYFEFCLPHIKKIFPDFNPEWVSGYSLWRANYSQPVICKHYSRLIPDLITPIEGLFLSTMAQVYPEDRGTSYAIDAGRRAARELIKS
jgi:protoporphyrinogen oxidase